MCLFICNKIMQFSASIQEVTITCRWLDSSIQSSILVFASSCSMYGQSNSGARKETDTLNPLTAYARSKIGTEENLKKTAAITNAAPRKR